MNQTPTKEVGKPAAKELTKRTIARSEYPFRVFDGRYQFKELESARKFSSELAATPRSGHKHKVEMLHRSLEFQVKTGGTPVVHSILLDVTTDSAEQAEAKWKP